MNRFLIIFALLNFITSPAFAFKAHEWGTFTSLVGSNGVTQDGMYHEDEPLPDFVHGFGETQFLLDPIPQLPGGNCQNMKICFSTNALNNNVITQKMETPVIYFYGDKAERVTVDVAFPEGIITDTFPAPVSSSPKNSDDLVIENGKARFKVDLMPGSGLFPPAVDSDNIYGHARKVDSLMIKTNNEVEKFIFYRGLGRFQPTIDISSEGDSFNFRSYDSNRPLAAFLVYKAGGKPHMLPVIDENGKSVYETISKAKLNYHFFNVPENHIAQLRRGGGYDANVLVGGEPFDVLTRALINNGLKKDEAKAMVRTWADGYFKTPGLRMLYILPRKEVDRILPLTMTPAPEKMERVFVARLEIMTEKDEFDLVSKIMEQQKSFDVKTLGRLAEPKTRRAYEVYLEQHSKAIPEIPGFNQGLMNVLELLVEQSKTQTIETANVH